MWFPFFILEEYGVFIKTTDDTTTDNYVTQGMCVCVYTCMYTSMQKSSRRVGRDCFGNLPQEAFLSYYTENVIIEKLVYLAFAQFKICYINRHFVLISNIWWSLWKNPYNLEEPCEWKSDQINDSYED